MTLEAVLYARIDRVWRSASTGILPGLCLTGAIALIAFVLRLIPVVALFSPMILSILIGTAFHNVLGTPQIAKAGITFSLRRILRFAIVLLGIQLTISQVTDVGTAGAIVIASSLVVTFWITKWLAWPFGVDPKLAELIAAGTSICGASAVIATNTVTRGSEEDVAYAVAAVTALGSIAMFVWPLWPSILHLDPRTYGLWTGASIHEIAQVVAAAFQNSKESGDLATIAKLTRVMLLAPLVITLGFLRRGGSAPGDTAKAPPIPWFVLGFMAVIALNSVITIPPATKGWIVQLTLFLLSVALAAMGMMTDIRKLLAKGLRPLLLACASWFFISGFSLALILVWRNLSL
ncbi:MAG TPA: YeiH family protein [Stellaceae bacterium]|nr:YeiH family protein [Stellaceae bacterium]